MANIVFKSLFQIQVLLQDYSEVLLNDIEIYPTAETQEKFDNYRLKFTTYNDAIFVFTEIVKTNKSETRITLPPDLKFEFRLKFKNEKFKNNYSNLSNYNLESNVFYFDNKTGFKNGTNLFLFSDYSAYNAANAYEKGYLVTNSGNLFFAQQYNDSASPKSTSNATFWKPIVNNSYLSQGNLVTRISLATTVDEVTYTNIENNEFGKIIIYNSGISSDFAITTPVDASTPDDIAAGRTIMGTLPNEKKFILQFKNYKNS